MLLSKIPLMCARGRSRLDTRPELVALLWRSQGSSLGVAVGGRCILGVVLGASSACCISGYGKSFFFLIVSRETIGRLPTTGSDGDIRSIYHYVWSRVTHGVDGSCGKQEPGDVRRSAQVCPRLSNPLNRRGEAWSPIDVSRPYEVSSMCCCGGK